MSLYHSDLVRYYTTECSLLSWFFIDNFFHIYRIKTYHLGPFHIDVPYLVMGCDVPTISVLIVVQGMLSVVPAIILIVYSIVLFRETYPVARVWLLSRLASPLYRDYRREFTTACNTAVLVHGQANHTHGDAASDRIRADTILNAFCIDTSRTRYEYQTAPRQSHHDGSLTWYFAKDLRTDQKSDVFDINKHILVMIDVDYYVNMSRFLDGKYLAIYSFTPIGVAAESLNSSYSFLPNGNLQQVVTGGARYNHPLWDYNVDEIVSTHWWGRAYYIVHRHKLSQDRSLILFNPIRIVYGFFTIRAFPLARRKVVETYKVDGEPVSVATSRDGSYVYMSIAGSSSQAIIPESLFNTAVFRSKLSKTTQASDLERIFHNKATSNGVELAVNDAALAALTVTIALRACAGLSLPPADRPTDRSSYQPTKGLTLEIGKPTMRSFEAGILPGYSCTKSYNSDLQMVEGRINSVRNDVSLTHQMVARFGEFVKFLKADSIGYGTLVPLAHDVYTARLTKSSQRLRSAEVADSLASGFGSVGTFLKAEAHAGIKDPRNITTLPPNHNFHLGQFTYALADLLKTTKWYLPGKSPTEIADLVRSLAAGSSSITTSDVHRMDGSTSLGLRSLFTSFFCGAFAENHQSHARTFLVNETNIRAHTAHDVRYNTGGTILSGSSCTSQLGSIINAFICYWALSKRHTPDIAYQKLGLYFGDDGLTADLPANLLTLAAKEVGMTYDSETRVKHSHVTFLARYYIDPWTTNQSIADVSRQISKFHMTSLPEAIPWNLILNRKAQAFLINDPNTPILSCLCRNVIRLCGDNIGTKYEEMLQSSLPYWVHFDSAFPSPPSGCITTLAIVAESVGIDAAVVADIEDKWNKVTSSLQLFQPIIDKPVPQSKFAHTYQGNYYAGQSSSISPYGAPMPSAPDPSLVPYHLRKNSGSWSPADEPDEKLTTSFGVRTVTPAEEVKPSKVKTCNYTLERCTYAGCTYKHVAHASNLPLKDPSTIACRNIGSCNRALCKFSHVVVNKTKVAAVS